MKLSRVPALALAGALACDTLLTMGSTTQGQSPVVHGVGLLSLLQVGPAVRPVNLHGGGECGCTDLPTSGQCSAEPDQTCTGKYTVCEAPTQQERCIYSLKEVQTSNDCTMPGCVKHALRTYQDCTAEPNCGAGG